MADILIRGMEMPGNCRECRFAGFGGIRSELNVCMFSGESQSLRSHERMSKCPLVPLPEGHGRLIDAGSLYDRLENTLTHFIKVKSYTESQKYAFGYCEAWNDAKAVLTNAPTIVPAEGGTDNG